MPELHEDDAVWERVLQDGEVVLWKGNPVQGLLFERSDIFPTVFSLFYIYICYHLIKIALSNDFAIILLLGAVPPLIGGLHVLFVRHVRDLLARKRISYLITNNRFLVLDKANSMIKEFLHVNHSYALESNGNKDIGTISADKVSAKNASGLNYYLEPRLAKIPNSPDVYEILSQVKGVTIAYPQTSLEK